MTKTHEQHVRELGRWQVVTCLYAGLPIGCSDNLIHSAIIGDNPTATITVIHHALDYLAKKGLVELRKDGSNWFGNLTDKGIDFFEGNTPDIQGIARPPKHA